MRTAYLLFLIVLSSAMVTAPEVDGQEGGCNTGMVSGLCYPTPDSADDVAGLSEIQVPYNNWPDQGLTTYSVTVLGADLVAYYDPYVSASVLLNGAQIWHLEVQNYAELTAVAEPETPFYTIPSSIYTLNSSHGVGMMDSDEEGNPGGGETTGYSNPELFLPSTEPASSFYGDFPPGGGPPVCGYPTEVLFSTTFQVDTTPPHITNVYNHGTTTPASAVVGSTGMVDIVGDHLTAAGNDPEPQVGIGGSGFTQFELYSDYSNPSNPLNPTDSLLTVSYQVSQTAPPGQGVVQVETYAGYSCGGTETPCGVANGSNYIQVGDATPVINTYSPNTVNLALTPETQVAFTITGSGFGSNPTVTLTVPSGASFTGVCQAASNGPLACGTAITSTINIPANTPATSLCTPPAITGCAVLTVTSTGYTNSTGTGTTGFLPVQPGGSSTSNGEPVEIDAAQPPAPTIVWGQGAGVCQTGSAVPPVVVGQLVAITGCLPPTVPVGDVLDQVWSFPAAFLQNVVAGYNPSASNNQQVSYLSGPIGCAPAQVSCNFPVFYPVSPGSPQQYTLTYRYDLNNGGSGSVQVALQVTGPTATGADGAYLTAQLQPAPPNSDLGLLVTVWPPQAPRTDTALELGDGESGSPGIMFNITAQENNAGSFQFVQLISRKDQQVVVNPAFNNGNAIYVAHLGTGLDNWYPYAAAINNPLVAGDFPSFSLVFTVNNQPEPIGESSGIFSANMYVMWDPALPGPGQNNCHAASNNPVNGQPNPQASTCRGSIPVPLGYIAWGFVGDTVNTLNPLSAGTATTTMSVNTTDWAVVLGCPGNQNVAPSAPNPAVPVFQANSAYQVASYPTWNSIFQNQQ